MSIVNNWNYCILLCNAVSKASKNYIDWITDREIIILDAYTIKNTDSILNIADGIILTGGEDINPLQYHDTINIAVCGDINYNRDTLERKLFDFAFRKFALSCGGKNGRCRIC